MEPPRLYRYAAMGAALGGTRVAALGGDGGTPAALAAVKPGGTVVCGGIHMSDIPAFPYALLWGERVLRSVANLTRRDAEEFLQLAPQVPVRTRTTTFPLAAANEALAALRDGRLEGAAVLLPTA